MPLQGYWDKSKTRQIGAFFRARTTADIPKTAYFTFAPPALENKGLKSQTTI